jgi:hypothetical protein
MIDSKLSAPSFMIANVMANPWERLRTEWPEVEVTYEDLGTRWAVLARGAAGPRHDSRIEQAGPSRSTTCAKPRLSSG